MQVTYNKIDHLIKAYIVLNYQIMSSILLKKFSHFGEKYKLSVNYLGLPKVFLEFYGLTYQEIFLHIY
jgi:hypothetical protein